MDRWYEVGLGIGEDQSDVCGIFECRGVFGDLWGGLGDVERADYRTGMDDRVWVGFSYGWGDGWLGLALVKVTLLKFPSSFKDIQQDVYSSWKLGAGIYDRISRDERAWIRVACPPELAS